MKLITIHNKEVLKELETAINKADRNADIHAFEKYNDARDYLKAEKADAVFIDYKVNGIELTKACEELISIQPDINIILIMGFDTALWVPRGTEKMISGMIFRKVSGHDIRRELDNLKFKVSESMHEYFDPDSLKQNKAK